jgi:hypothetical protein
MLFAFSDKLGRLIESQERIAKQLEGPSAADPAATLETFSGIVAGDPR